jgi:tetratricopeptide (TPR) repeat protein
MPEVAVNTLELRLQKQVESARVAFEKGRYEHAVETAGLVLREQPSCLPVRKLMRAAQLKLASGKSGLFGRMMTSMSSAPFVLGGSFQLKDKPLNAVVAADKLLASDANNVAALTLLGQGAGALGWLETAVFAYDAARSCEPDRPDLNLALGLALLAAGRAAEAVQAAQDVLRIQPNHAEGQDLLRNASIAVTMAKGNWETQGNYRGKLNDEAKAVQLEQAARLAGKTLPPQG